MKRGSLNKIFRLDDHWFLTHPNLVKYESLQGRNIMSSYKLGEIMDDYICLDVDEISNWYLGLVNKRDETEDFLNEVREAVGLTNLNVKFAKYKEANITDGFYKPAFYEYRVTADEFEGNGIIERLTTESARTDPEFEEIPSLHVRTYIIAPNLECRFKNSSPKQKFGVQGRYSLMIENSEDQKTFITDIVGTEKNHIWLQAIMFSIASTAEVLISIVGLEYCYSEAPLKLRSTMAAIWFLMVGFANVPPMFLTKKEYFPVLNSHSMKMYQLALYLSIAAVPAMIATGYFYTPKRDEQDDEEVEEVCLEGIDDQKNSTVTVLIFSTAIY